MDVKKLISEQSLRLLADPRVAKLVQDERFHKAVDQARQTRQRLQESIHESVESVAKSLGLVTQKQHRELRRNLTRVERELSRAKSAADKARAAEDHERK